MVRCDRVAGLQSVIHGLPRWWKRSKSSRSSNTKRSKSSRLLKLSVSNSGTVPCGVIGQMDEDMVVAAACNLLLRKNWIDFELHTHGLDGLLKR